MTFEGKVLVTGAGGFIGGWLVETLYLNGSTDVRAGIHTWSGAVRPARFPLEIVLCDIMDPGQLEKALSGMDCVIHCAKGSSASIVQGTRNVLEAALRHRVGRFVYISTTEVYGNPNGTVDETAPCPITGDPYGDSKIEAERLCWEYYARGLPVVVIRPPIVYGPFSETWTVNIAFKLQSGNWGVFGDQGEGICNLIYIADLVSGILVAARHERAVGEVFNLNGPETLTWNQYFESFNAAMCLEPLKVISPGQAARQARTMEPVRVSAKFALSHFGTPIKGLAARVLPLKQVMKSVERTIKTTPRPADLALFSRKALYSCSKAQEAIGFNPRFDLDAGLALTLAWMNQVGLWDRGP